MQLSISEVVDTVNNKSTLTWTLTSAGGSSSYYTIGETTVTINGTKVYHKDRTYYDAYVFPAAKGSKSGTIEVLHGTDGKKSINVSFKTRVYTWDPLEYGGNITLTSIDRAAPSVTHSISNITAAGFKISATSSTAADKWDYSLDGGSTYKNFSNAEGSSASVTLSTLNPNTQYTVKVRARRKLNQVFGYSTAASVKTLGASSLNSAENFSADTTEPAIRYTVTVYDASYFHVLAVKHGEDTLFTATLGALTAGTAMRMVTLTKAQRELVLNAMPNAKSLDVTLELTTYSANDYSTQIGTVSTTTCLAMTSAAISAPVFDGFECFDSNALTVEATGDSSVLIENYSVATIACAAGVAKNGASIKSYSASIGDVSATSTDTTFDVGEVGTHGDLVITVSCTDSRGYSTSIQKTVKVLQYAKPKLNTSKLRRRNEIDALVQLSFSGTFSVIKADGENNTNDIVYCSYRFKKTNEEEYGEAVSILGALRVTSSMFSFDSAELLELDAESSFDFLITVEDKLRRSTVLEFNLLLRQGTPIVSLRKKNSRFNFARVGINNPKPERALDVFGDGAFSGGLFLGKPLPKQCGGTGSDVVYEDIELEVSGISSAKVSCKKIPYLGMYLINISGVLNESLSAGTMISLANVPSEHRPATTYALPVCFSSGSVGVIARISSDGNVGIRATGAKASGDHIYISGWWIK